MIKNYLQAVSVCDYAYNVDCQGAATPKPLPIPEPEPENGGPSGGSNPQQPPQGPSSGGSSPGTGGSQQPIQPPTGGSQQPTQPPPVTFPPGAYPQNSWGFRTSPDSWYQRSVNSPSVIDDNQPKTEALQSDPPTKEQDTSDGLNLNNAWETMHAIPVELTKVPCQNGMIHRLDDACTSVVVCKNNKPQLVQCDTGLTYDKQSDSCRHFNVAKW